MKFTQLLEIQQIINEIGDLSLIKPYEFKKLGAGKYEFIDVDNDIINLQISKIDNNRVRYIKDFPTVLLGKQGREVFYTVNNIDTQFKTSNYSNLLRILKTIVEIVLEYVNTYIVDYLFIKDTSKVSKDKNITTKDKLYAAIIDKNLSDDWAYTISNIAGWNAILLTKKQSFK